MDLRDYAGLPRMTISVADYNELLEYSSSIPTGKFVGKMWRCQLRGGRWVIRGYQPDAEPGYLSIPTWRPRFAFTSGSVFLEMGRQWRDSLVKEKYSTSHANLRHDVVARIEATHG